MGSRGIVGPNSVFCTMPTRQTQSSQRSQVIMQATQEAIYEKVITCNLDHRQKSKPNTTCEDFKIFRGAQSRLMGAADNLRQMTAFPLILTKGGDCRLPLDPKTGANKYHVKPFVHDKTTAFRGSCTCNSPTQVAFDAAEYAYDQLMSGETTVELLMHETRKKLKDMYTLPEGTGLFLMPSGSDAEYIPLLIAQLLN